jgi:hypothetical protein
MSCATRVSDSYQCEIARLWPMAPGIPCLRDAQLVPAGHLLQRYRCLHSPGILGRRSCPCGECVRSAPARKLSSESEGNISPFAGAAWVAPSPRDVLCYTRTLAPPRAEDTTHERASRAGEPRQTASGSRAAGFEQSAVEQRRQLRSSGSPAGVFALVSLAVSLDLLSFSFPSPLTTPSGCCRRHRTTAQSQAGAACPFLSRQQPPVASHLSDVVAATSRPLAHREAHRS